MSNGITICASPIAQCVNRREAILSRAQKNRVTQSNIEIRKTLAEDLEAFLASGKKIEQVPMGVSGQDKMGRSKNIVISRRKTAVKA